MWAWIASIYCINGMIVFISGLAGFALGAVAGMVLKCLMQVRR